MVGGTTYTLEEINNARFSFAAQLDAYATLAGEITGDTAVAALADFEPLFFNNLVLALDRCFVHREHANTGANGHPPHEAALIEVALIVDSLINHNAVLPDAPIEGYRPEDGIVGLEPGDDIRLTAEEFERLSSAFLGELEARSQNKPAG